MTNELFTADGVECISREAEPVVAKVETVEAIRKHLRVAQDRLVKAEATVAGFTAQVAEWSALLDEFELPHIKPVTEVSDVPESIKK